MTYRTDIPILAQLRLPRAPLSTRLMNAIGILKGRRGAHARKEIRKMRREWAQREKRQIALARGARA